MHCKCSRSIAPTPSLTCPGCEADARHARALGYVAKSAVDPTHVAAINRVMTPAAEEVREARSVVEALEAARAAGRERARCDLLIEVPAYFSAKRLLARATALRVEGA